MKSIKNKILKCPNCGFKNKLKKWIDNEWIFEGCPHCDTYNFEETELFKNYSKIRKNN